jgi:Rrf2 family protein
MIPRTGRYAVRAMVWMAAQPSDQSFTTRQLSEKTHVPPEYLAKILRRLAVAGLLRSRRGRGGGYSLARAPATIRILDVLVALDVTWDDDVCAFGNGTCDVHLPCPMHAAWTELRQATRSWAERHTLAGIDPAPNPTP